jgi:hypothetical protein
MNFAWAICVAREDAAALAALRLQRGIEVAEAPEGTWLRGQGGDDALTAMLAALPATGRYEWYPQKNRLRRLNERLSATPLPDLNWQPLREWAAVEAPLTALPASRPEAVTPTLIRSEREQEPSVILTGLAEWEAFVQTAAQVRLDRLQFAAAADGQVVIRGTPLPPVTGRRYVLHEGSVAAPAGFGWTPDVSAKVLKKLFNVSPGALVMWNDDGTITSLPEEQFIPATRRAMLATRRAITVSS